MLTKEHPKLNGNKTQAKKNGNKTTTTNADKQCLVYRRKKQTNNAWCWSLFFLLENEIFGWFSKFCYLFFKKTV